MLAHLLAALMLLQTPSQTPPRPQAPPIVPARANDNRARAGILYGSTFVLRLDARLAEWHPNGDDEPGAVVPAFGEQGRIPQIPGPLIRVPGGTDVIVTVRNVIPNTTLTMHGLHVRPAIGALFNDSITLAPGAMETLRFRLDRPGTYYYWGTTTGRGFNSRTRDDAQLTGAIVVDEPGIGERPGNDRVLVIGGWTDTSFTPQTRRRARELFVMNGRAWPYTEHLQYARGDTVRWRVINASADVHAMHLHGFFFRVLRRGDGRADTVMASRDAENTERMAPGGTMYATWIASRLGNWLFHCDIPSHFMERGALGYAAGVTHVTSSSVTAAPVQGSSVILPNQGLGGLVSDVEVKLGEDDSTDVVPMVPPVRSLHMTIGNAPGAGAGGGGSLQPHYYSIAVQEGTAEPPPMTETRAGPTIVLNRSEPTQIVVLNRLTQPTSVHWHGLELESVYDGVPGISGARPDTTPAIAPDDSFDIRISPPRAGTFLYHSFVDVVHQMRAGIVGTLLVVDKRTYDATKDFAFLFTSPLDSAQEEHAVLVNGAPALAPLTLRRGGVYRLRFLNGTTTRPELAVQLRYADPRDSSLASWRPLAKDGADLAASGRTLRAARRPLTIGETADFEFSPLRAGEYRIEARAGDGTVLGTVTLRAE
jgi:manganese oxidase